MAIIYLIKCDLDKESNGYIGVTTATLSKRWNQHKTDFRYYLNGNASVGKRFITYMCESVKIYGMENFIITKVEECEDSVIDEREIYYINNYNTLYPNGYNNQLGGKSGKQSDSTKQLISEKTKIGIHKNIDNIRTYDYSKGLPVYISFFKRNDTGGKITRHGYNVSYLPSGKRRTVTVPIDKPITDDMLVTAKNKLQELIDDHQSQLLKNKCKQEDELEIITVLENLKLSKNSNKKIDS